MGRPLGVGLVRDVAHLDHHCRPSVVVAGVELVRAAGHLHHHCRPSVVVAAADALEVRPWSLEEAERCPARPQVDWYRSSILRCEQSSCRSRPGVVVGAARAPNTSQWSPFHCHEVADALEVRPCSMVEAERCSARPQEEWSRSAIVRCEKSVRPFETPIVGPCLPGLVLGCSKTLRCTCTRVRTGVAPRHAIAHADDGSWSSESQRK